MTSPNWWLPIIGSLIGLCIFSCLSETQREFIAQKLRFRQCRIFLHSGNDKSGQSEDNNNGNGNGTVAVRGLPKSEPLRNTFPPSQREQLNKIVSTLSSLSSAQREVLERSSLHYNEQRFRTSLLGKDENYNTASETKCFPSGISIKEIRALGEFPDYAALSGVPLPEEYTGFDIEKALPRPYRPFRWGYFQTMSLSKLDPNYWLELENTYTARIAERRQLYAQHGDAILQALPGTEYACKELMQMVLQYLCARYPRYFSLSPSLSSNESPSRFHNKILGTTTDLQNTIITTTAWNSVGDGKAGCKEGIDALLVLLDNVPEDFAVMVRDETSGEYVFRAGVICSSLGWNLGTKMGKTLAEIHGVVPDYKEKMGMSMDRFFSRLAPSKPIARGSWTFEIDQPLFSLPLPPPSHLSSTSPPSSSSQSSLKTPQNPNLDPSRIHLRVDWQTLRRLPLSGAIAFNFKALFTPISEFQDESGVPGLVAHVLRHGNERILEYKSTRKVEHLLVPLLESWDEEQRRDGVIEGYRGNIEEGEGWEEPRTLEESPFFEGWEEKWHRQQGF